MIVVSDTGPLNYLSHIGHLDVLNVLYGAVVIPPAVSRELSHPSSPERIRELLRNPPTWLSIANSPPIDAALRDLGEGEQQAIMLARSIRANLLLCDDRDAREAAIHCGLKVVGTLGVLYDAAKRHLLDLPGAIESLRRTNFRISKTLLDRILKGDE